MDDTEAFFAAYDAVLRRWPVEVDGVDVPTPYGSTRVHIAGREDGPPLVLLPGGGTTSTAWFANAATLAPAHRIHAVDLMGDIGRSVHDGAPLRGAADLMAWLDSLFDELKLDGAQLCGHSYGAWIALNYALHAPHRLGRLALLDPVGCFTGLSPRYLTHALPMLLKPTAERVRAFHRWETGRDPEDPVWQAFLGSTASAHRSKVVALRRPAERDLATCAVPALVVLAEHSRAHNPRRAAATARRLLPGASVVVLPGATHHSLPTERPAELNRLLTEFLS
ncbi:Pimeloyl-ACP methyl ester carboxylesterase [Streptomyces sp. Ag82_O1-12]|uniref:alpha/beta fold hydrolase n=1 Tax=unclassified Streptomyces TaxID=2593676 RepID=UPI000BC620D7|nr:MULTISPECIES: alpha/beta hydrolase [unclassified Streptomyces]SMQ21058.1 Pimeloyl-ACP methyl ester carboxylesterase [Streptomyces sp. Ag82_O1-12]SOD49678.1 Pimeloyl-ACP methyl ester carboxylesterase [Streptomyces sp. Ag82_G6-1]